MVFLGEAGANIRGSLNGFYSSIYIERFGLDFIFEAFYKFSTIYFYPISPLSVFSTSTS